MNQSDLSILKAGWSNLMVSRSIRYDDGFYSEVFLILVGEPFANGKHSAYSGNVSTAKIYIEWLKEDLPNTVVFEVAGCVLVRVENDPRIWLQLECQRQGVNVISDYNIEALL